jgi:hypothetical protein
VANKGRDGKKFVTEVYNFMKKRYLHLCPPPCIILFLYYIILRRIIY